jgi:Flp pilus assembly protein CpaB
MSENPDRKMLDDLKHSVPVARPAFQHDLEKRLLAQLEEKEKPFMTTLTIPARRPHTYRPLVAAAVLVVLLASVLLWQGGKPPAPGYEMVIGETIAASPTPLVMMKVLIAKQNLPRGYHFPDDVNALNEVVGYVPLPDYAVPVSALTEADNSLEKLSGQYLRTDVVREQTLLSTLLTSDYAGLAAVSSDDSSFRLQQLRDLEIQIAQLQQQLAQAKVDQARLTARAEIDANRRDQAQAVTSLLELFELHASMIAGLGNNFYQPVFLANHNLTKGSSILPGDITIVLWPKQSVPSDAANTTKAVLNYILQRDIAQWQPILASDLQLPLPDGTIPVTIPIRQLESLPDGIAEGDHFDIWASFLLVNVDSTAGTPGPLLLNPQGTIMPQTVITLPPDAQLQRPVTAIPGNALHNTTQRTTQVIVHDAVVVQGSTLCAQGDTCDDVMVLAVSPQEADMLLWIINAKLPLRLVKVGGK